MVTDDLICSGVIGFITILGLSMAGYMGFFTPLEVHQIRSQKVPFYYIETQRNYIHLKYDFFRLNKSLQKLISMSELEESDYNLILMFFDDPELLMNPNQARGAIGIGLKESSANLHKILMDAGKYTFTKFNFKMLPSTNVLEVKFIDKDLSYSDGLKWWQGHGSLFDHFFQNHTHILYENTFKNWEVPLIEIFEKDMIRIMHPIGKERISYALSTVPTPLQKPHKRKEKLLILNMTNKTTQLETKRHI
jgi:hypothetical protein